MDTIVLAICALVASVLFALFFGAFAAAGDYEIPKHDPVIHDEHEELTL